MDATLFEGSQLSEIAFSRDNRPQDGKTRGATNIADHPVQLPIHLGQGFLHPLDVG